MSGDEMSFGFSDTSLPPSVRQFISSRITSFITWDLVRFFHDNPHARDTAENIARHISRDLQPVHQELFKMTESGLLEGEIIGDVEVFNLTADPETRQLISHFMEACHDRNFRRLAIHQVFEGMQSAN